jgi:hypothetical protein
MNNYEKLKNSDVDFFAYGISTLILAIIRKIADKLNGEINAKTPCLEAEDVNQFYDGIKEWLLTEVTEENK